MNQALAFSGTFSDTFENAPIGIFQTTPDGYYIRVNRALAVMYGYASPEEMLADLTDIGGQLYTSATRRAEFMATLEKDGAVNSFKSEIRCRNGEKIWISEDARIVTNSDGSPFYYEGFVRNVTVRHNLQREVADLNASLEERVIRRTEELQLENQRRKLAEASLRDALDKANNAIEAKANFLANVSHELRTPLNAIIGFSDIMTQELMGPMKNPTYAEYADHILGSGQHLLNLINGLLDLSKIEAGGVELKPADINIQDLLGECVTMLGVKAQENDIAFTHASAGTPVNIKGDALRLKQVFLNLISNAIKFTPKEGEVSVSASVSDTGEAVVRISDTGIGIAPEDIPKVFQEYGQAEHGLDHLLEGTGLGLPISKKLVEMHKGTLKLESQPDVGTTAVVTLPVPHPPLG